MQSFHDFLKQIEGAITSELFVFFLLGTGLFFSIYLRFPQFRFFKRAFRSLKSGGTGTGDTSPFQALSTALSGTVGTGNIAGVALAIHIGGPAALFWMLVTAFLGMTTKMVEVTLSHKYREKASDGTMSGGPMYFMQNKLNMRWMAVLFAIATVISAFGTGSLPQINSIANIMHTTFSIDKMLTGAVLAALLALVIIGGIKRIAQVTSRLVPTMAVIYFIGALGVIIVNVENIVPAFLSIFSSIFIGSSATGGFLGASVAYAFNRGVNRGLFSNEAGQGSSPIAHASAKAKHPVSEGIVALLEPFIDTIIICLITGLVILSSGVWEKKFYHEFQLAEVIVVDKKYSEHKEQDVQVLYEHYNNGGNLPLYTGELVFSQGRLMTPVSILHSRSIAEQVKLRSNGQPYSGSVSVIDGKVSFHSYKEFITRDGEHQTMRSKDKYSLEGYSLKHSAPLTAEAFKKGLFGDWGEYIIAIGLLLFAFSTSISWSYYGDRAIVFLFGINAIIYFRVFYVIGFFVASFTDTVIIWTLSGITIAVMTIPNLIGILLLRKDMKETLDDFVKKDDE